jgi:uncharacterized protein DUF7019
MPMTWQEMTFCQGRSDQKMALFSGHDPESQMFVGLVGSAAYVTGMNDLEPASLGYAQPRFWNEVIEKFQTPGEEEIENNLYELRAMIDYQARRRTGGPPKQVLEFVAKTFIAKDGFIIGSPLFVAESTGYFAAR